MSHQTKPSTIVLGTSNSSSVDNTATNDLIKNKSENIIIREIEVCLAPCNQCTGNYSDVITGNKLRLICRHSCHTITKKVEEDKVYQPIPNSTNRPEQSSGNITGDEIAK
jgi:hypothetical protein